jgi:hypothetical protein
LPAGNVLFSRRLMRNPSVVGREAPRSGLASESHSHGRHPSQRARILAQRVSASLSGGAFSCLRTIPLGRRSTAHKKTTPSIQPCPGSESAGAFFAARIAAIFAGAWSRPASQLPPIHAGQAPWPRSVHTGRGFSLCGMPQSGFGEGARLSVPPLSLVYWRAPWPRSVSLLAGAFRIPWMHPGTHNRVFR